MRALRTKARLSGFDGLRAFAAFAVLAYHLEFFAPVGHGVVHELFQQLRVGVWVFFTLSGFLLYRGWASAHLDGTDAPRLGEYFRNRVLRIFPAYWLALVWFTWKGVTLLGPALGLGPVVRQFTLTQIYSTADVATQFGMPRGLPQTWSLAVELSFYLTLPLYAWAIGRLGARLGRVRGEWLGVATLVAVFVVWTTATNGNAIHQQWLPNFTMAFGSGIALAVLSTGGGGASRVARSAIEALRRHWAIVWGLAIVLVVVRSQLSIRAENGLVSQLLYTAIATCIVAPVAFADSGAPAVRVLDSAPLRFLGSISYGVFLWHYLVIRSVRDDWLGGAPSFLHLAAYVVPITIAVATASWFVVERPILRQAHRDRPMDFRPALGVITFGALAWRVYYVLCERGRLRLNGDARHYHLQANAVAKGLGFVVPENLVIGAPLMQSAAHPPAYIAYLAVFSRVGLDTETAHRLASCLLGALAVAVIGLVARELAGDRTGLVAAVFAAGYANLWINDEMLMSESMAALATALVLLAVVRFHRSPSLRRGVWVGAAVGFAALSRAELIALSVLIVVPLVLAVRSQPWKRRGAWLVAAGLSCTLVIAPWVGYNLSRFHRPVYLSTGLGDVTLYGNCDATYSGTLIGYWYAYCNPAVSADLHGDESDRQALWGATGRAYMDAHRDRLPAVMAARIGRMWEVYRISQNTSLNAAYEGRGLGASRLANVQYYFLLAGSIAGLVVLRRRRQIIWPFLVIAGLTTVTAMTSFGITRYRIPVDVFLPVLAAVACTAAWERFRRPRPEDTDLLRTGSLAVGS